MISVLLFLAAREIVPEPGRHLDNDANENESRPMPAFSPTDNGCRSTTSHHFREEPALS